MAAQTIRFRTQDTRAGTSRKLNALLVPVLSAQDATRYRHAPQTLEQWQHHLNFAVRALVTLKYNGATGIVFRLGETKSIWARKLNLLSAAVAAGPTA